MDLTISFFVNSILLGVGLAMDAFSVSMANGLNEPKMKKNKIFLIAFVFGAFQTAMPLIGWVCVHTALEKFKAFEKFIPWIALILLGFIGGKMIFDGIKGDDESSESKGKLGAGALLLQGVATSIDALSVGFTIANYNLTNALISTLIIGFVTFIICVLGVFIGKKFGTKLSKSASIIGGAILIAIGLEIFITGII